jgi:hypothetical protein
MIRLTVTRQQLKTDRGKRKSMQERLNIAVFVDYDNIEIG